LDPFEEPSRNWINSYNHCNAWGEANAHAENPFIWKRYDWKSFNRQKIKRNGGTNWIDDRRDSRDAWYLSKKRCWNLGVLGKDRGNGRNAGENEKFRKRKLWDEG